MEENEPLYLKAKYLYELTDELFDLSESTLFDPFLEAKESKGDTKSFAESLRVYLEQEEAAAPDLGGDFDSDFFSEFFEIFGGFDVDSEEILAA